MFDEEEAEFWATSNPETIEERRPFDPIQYRTTDGPRRRDDVLYDPEDENRWE